MANLCISNFNDKILERVGGEFMTGYLTLEAPKGAITVEDATAKEVGEVRVEAWAFGVAIEAGLEDVLDVLGVGCGDGDPAASDDAAGKRGGAVEDLAGPLVEAVLVEEDEREAAHQREGRKPRIGPVAGMMPP